MSHKLSKLALGYTSMISAYVLQSKGYDYVSLGLFMAAFYFFITSWNSEQV